MTLLSTDHTLAGILLRVLVLLAIWGIIYLIRACKNAPVMPEGYDEQKPQNK